MNFFRKAWSTPGRGRPNLAAHFGGWVFVSLLVPAVLIAPCRESAPAPIPIDGILPADTSGFYDVEHFGGLAYRWTTGSAHTNFANVMPNQRYELSLLVTAGARPQDAAAPIVTVAINGKETYIFRPDAGWSTFSTIVEPQGVNPSNGMNLDLSVPPFVPQDAIPGSTDTRSLGVLVQQIILHPVGSSGKGMCLPAAGNVASWLLAG
jgi:hypothetical protein